MINFNARQRYFMYRSPTDMRKGFDGLSGLVRQAMAADPLSDPAASPWPEKLSFRRLAPRRPKCGHPLLFAGQLPTKRTRPVPIPVRRADQAAGLSGQPSLRPVAVQRPIWKA